MPHASLPQFQTLQPADFTNQLEALLQNNLTQIEQLLTQKQPFTWENLMRPMEDMDDALEKLWSPFDHLHAVVNSPELRQCYKDCLPKLSAYESAMGQNRGLYDAVASLDKSALNATQKKLVEDALRGFELSGVALPEEKKQRFEVLETRLSELSNQFENNVLDATQAFNLHISDEKRLKGLPEHALLTARETAKAQNLAGWVLNLEFPCYLAVMTYAEDRSLRETLYHAFVTRASDQGPAAGQFDNSAVINEILKLKHEEALLLGFTDYAELSLAVKMADSTDQVIDFLTDLSNKAHNQALSEVQQLQNFARTDWQLNELAPWDVAFLTEKMCQRDFRFSQEDLRPYFPLEKVMSGLLTIINRLYGLQLEKIHNTDTWHPDVICYRLLDEDNKERGFVYMDLFARQNKRGGAWMGSLQTRRRLSDNSIQLPIATLNCNFARAAGNVPPVLSHDEVLTLFHEFGHCLHHLLSQVDYRNASGINGVEWDAVELPSQFFENWCWEESALQELTGHIETGDPLPKSLYKRMIAAKNFQSAMGMMRQLEFSLFDFRIHREYNEKPDFVTEILEQVRHNTCVLPLAPYNRFQHSFAHIFSGGYDAGYYSYKWAEVLSSDAYSRFEEEGIFNQKTGRDFLHNVLEAGGSRKASESFSAFRGREAKIDALLKHNGIILKE